MLWFQIVDGRRVGVRLRAVEVDHAGASFMVDNFVDVDCHDYFLRFLIMQNLDAPVPMTVLLVLLVDWFDWMLQREGIRYRKRS